MADYKEIEHSGDIGLEIRAGSLPEIYHYAALGLFDLLYASEVGSTLERVLRVEASSYEDLLVDWLSEILSTFAACGEVYSDVSIKSFGECFVEGTLRGEEYEPSKHKLRLEVKAVTYHNLLIRRRGSGYQARVIFDL